MNEPSRTGRYRRSVNGVTAVALSCLMLALGACQSMQSISDRMESKYSLKKRKSYISCTRTEGLQGCPLPVRVSEQEYRQMLSWIDAAKGIRYRFGGTVPDGFDCSGFTRYLYDVTFRIQLPRTSNEQALVGDIVSRSNLKRGDLVFFSSNGSVVDHVGVFLGDGRFAHSGTRQGVSIASLRTNWYDSHFAFGARVIRIE